VVAELGAVPVAADAVVVAVVERRQPEPLRQALSALLERQVNMRPRARLLERRQAAQRLVADGAVAVAVVAAVADVAALRTVSRCLAFPMSHNMAYKPASPISAAWPRAYGMSPTLSTWRPQGATK
jgi:hypothetical protein